MQLSDTIVRSIAELEHLPKVRICIGEHLQQLEYIFTICVH